MSLQQSLDIPNHHDLPEMIDKFSAFDNLPNDGCIVPCKKQA
jgi:hypothetical protein